MVCSFCCSLKSNISNKSRLSRGLFNACLIFVYNDTNRFLTIPAKMLAILNGKESEKSFTLFSSLGQDPFDNASLHLVTLFHFGCFV